MTDTTQFDSNGVDSNDVDTNDVDPNETRTDLLPLLPLTQGVVFPQMVVTIALETDEAKQAGAAAEKAGRRLVLVPRVEGRYSTVGTIAQIENAGELPNGTLALVIRGVSRGRVGTGVVGSEGALHVEVEPVEDPAPTARARELAQEYRAVVETILEHRGARRIGDVLAGVDTPGQLADMAAYAPDLDLEQRVELLETVDVEARLELALSWARETLADLELKDRIRTEVTEGIDQQQREMLLRRQMDAIRKELGDSEEDAAAEYRVPRQRARASRLRSRGGRQGARPVRAHGPAESRAGLGAELARRGARPAVGNLRDRGRRSRCGALGVGCRSRRSRRCEGADPRIPRRARAAPRARTRNRGERSRLRVRSSAWSALRVSARPRSASRLPALWAARSCASPWVACATKPRSAVTGVLTSGRVPVASSARSPRRRR